MEWPSEVILFKGKMYWLEKLCVPDSLILEVLRAHHAWAGHLGMDRLISETQLRYAMGKNGSLRHEVLQSIKGCKICQATEPPRHPLKSKLSFTPVPERVMASVCIDIFSIKLVTWLGHPFDSVVICVDRHSGWIIAKPCTKELLTAKRAAHLMLDGAGTFLASQEL